MSTKENKEIVRRIVNKINSGDLSGMKEFCTDDFVYRSSAGEKAQGIEGFKELVFSYKEAFSNFEISLEELVAEDNKVFALYRQTGTHSGDFMGIEPTNNKMNLLVSAIGTYKNGKLIEQYDTFDTLEFLKQLDVVSKEVRPGGTQWPTGKTRLRPQN